MNYVLGLWLLVQFRSDFPRLSIKKGRSIRSANCVGHKWLLMTDEIMRIWIWEVSVTHFFNTRRLVTIRLSTQPRRPCLWKPMFYSRLNTAINEKVRGGRAVSHKMRIVGLFLEEMSPIGGVLQSGILVFLCNYVNAKGSYLAYSTWNHWYPNILLSLISKIF